MAQSPTPTSSRTSRRKSAVSGVARRSGSARLAPDERAADQAPTSAATSEKARIEEYFGARVVAIQQHFAALAATFPSCPPTPSRPAATLAADFHERGLIEILLLLAGFVALGFALTVCSCGELWRPASAARNWIWRRSAIACARPRQDRVRRRTSDAFALGSVGAIRRFRWRPLLKESSSAIRSHSWQRACAAHGPCAPGAPGQVRPTSSASGSSDEHDGRPVLVPAAGPAADWSAFGWVTLVFLEYWASRSTPATCRLQLGLGRSVSGSTGLRRPRAALGEVQPAPGRRRLGLGARNGPVLGYFLLLSALGGGAMPAFWLAGLLAPCRPRSA